METVINPSENLICSFKWREYMIQGHFLFEIENY